MEGHTLYLHSVSEWQHQAKSLGLGKQLLSPTPEPGPVVGSRMCNCNQGEHVTVLNHGHKFPDTLSIETWALCLLSLNTGRLVTVSIESREVMLCDF